jgi:hypothetical protein
MFRITCNEKLENGTFEIRQNQNGNASHIYEKSQVLETIYKIQTTVPSVERKIIGTYNFSSIRSQRRK